MSEQLSVIVSKLDKICQYLKPEFWTNFLNVFNAVILFITLLVLIFYTIETHKMAVQSKDANLRPVILRGGYLKDWNDLNYISGNSTPLQFTILKNIATDINGYIVINNKKHKLLFGNDITRIEDGVISYSELWGWMSPNTYIYAIFKDDGINVDSENKIVINYKDIEGGQYYSVENSVYQQKSFKK